MEKNKKIITIAGIALLISLISIGIAFAAMNQNLSIGSGEGTFNPATWDVKFKDGSLIKQTTGEASGTLPELLTTTIGSYSINLTKPGDSVTYTFIVENAGTLDAVIDSFSKPNPECIGTAGGAQGNIDASLICDNLVYTLTNDTKNGSNVATSQVLSKNGGSPTQQTMVLHIEYPMSMEQVPSDTVNLSFPQIVIGYVQAP